jgi:hypothetical protein
MNQDILIHKNLQKSHSKIPLNYKTCKNHVRPLVYPIEYEECPVCGCEKITRVKLGINYKIKI